MKYLSSVLVVITNYFFALNPGVIKYLILWIVSAIISTSYSYYWDLKYDWGFLVKGSKNKFLRDDLSYHKKSVYYAGKSFTFIEA